MFKSPFEFTKISNRISEFANVEAIVTCAASRMWKTNDRGMRHDYTLQSLMEGAVRHFDGPGSNSSTLLA